MLTKLIEIHIYQIMVLHALIQCYVSIHLSNTVLGRGRGGKENCSLLLQVIISSKQPTLCKAERQTDDSHKEAYYLVVHTASWETCMQVRKQQLELDMEQQTGSK